MHKTAAQIGPQSCTSASMVPSLRGFDGVVCFGGEDWWYHNHGHYDLQMMQRIAAHVPVLYVNSLGMRIPRPGEGRMFLTRVRRKLRSMRRGLVRVNDRMAVFSPIVLPGRAGMSLTRPLLANLVKSAARRLGIARPLVWVTCPTGAEAVEPLSPAAVVYQRTDRYECFKGVDTDRVRWYDSWLKARADLTIFCSMHLYECERDDCRRACYVDHGVDFDRFVSASAPKTPAPADMADLPRPRVGFVGGIDAHTFDPDLFKEVAGRLPEVRFVLVGSCSLPAGWCNLPNVHLLGQRPYEHIPQYMAACDVLIMPWNRSRWVEACNPVKLKEYLAVGRPVISTDFPELRRYDRLVRVAADSEEFANAIHSALIAPADPLPGRDRVERESWQSKADAALGELARQGIIPACGVLESIASPGQTQCAAAICASDVMGTDIVEPGADQDVALPGGGDREIQTLDGVSAIQSTRKPGRSATRRLSGPSRDTGDRADPPSVDLAACIILGGGLRPSPLVAATGRSVLDLWLTADHTVLDCWIDRIAEMGLDPPPPIRVVHDSSQPPPWPRTHRAAELIIEKEPKALRGPAGMVRDLCAGYSPDQHVLIVEAARYLGVPLSRMLREHAERGADITVASCTDKSPAGVYLLRCGTLDLVPSVGFIDLKEQWLQRAIDADLTVHAHRLPGPASLSLWTRRQFLTAARAANDVGPGPGERASLEGGLLTAGRWSGVRVICPGAVIGPESTIVDSIVMPDSIVGPKSLIVRSLICPNSRIQAGADIADAVVYAGECLSDDRRACV